MTRPATDDGATAQFAPLLEHACRLASGLEAMLKDKLAGDGDASAGDYARWVIAAELLSLLDEGRAALLLPRSGPG